MRKRMLALLMAGVMAFSLAACAGQSASTATAASEAGTSASAETETDTAASPEASTEAGQGSDGTEATDEGSSTGISADSFVPSKDFNIRVPFAAGGSADTIARIIAQGLSETYGNSAVINNLTGANGAIAAMDMDSVEADATELMVGGIALFTLAPLFSKDINISLDDYQMVCSLVSEDQMLFVCPAQTGIEDWDSFVEYAKNNRIIFGSNTPGGATHMLQTCLFGEAGIEAEAVTSDGSAKDLLAVVGGNAVCAAATSSLGAQYIEDGTLVPIVVFSDEPYTGYKGIEVPTAKSLGYDIVFKTCNFLMTRKDTDPDDVAAIYQAILDYSQTDEFKELAANANYIPDLSDGETVKQVIADAADLCQQAYDKYYSK